MYTKLGEPRYISFTTHRPDGSLASTPVWVVSDDGRRLLVYTGEKTWKVKRIRRDPRVYVAACSVRGRERGPRLAGTARILGPDAADLVVPLVRRKYGWQRRLAELMSRPRRDSLPATVYIEITESPPRPYSSASPASHTVTNGEGPESSLTAPRDLRPTLLAPLTNRNLRPAPYSPRDWPIHSANNHKSYKQVSAPLASTTRTHGNVGVHTQGGVGLSVSEPVLEFDDGLSLVVRSPS